MPMHSKSLLESGNHDNMLVIDWDACIFSTRGCLAAEIERNAGEFLTNAWLKRERTDQILALWMGEDRHGVVATTVVTCNLLQ